MVDQVETEQELVVRILDGDEGAETDFFRIYQPRLLRASMYFLGRQDSEAEDTVQETFIIAFPKLKDYVFRAPIYAWLRQICLRLCYARLRTRNRVLVSLEEDLELYMQRMAMERIQNEELDVQKQERLQLLARLRLHLNPDNLRILNLRDRDGLHYTQIAAILNIPMGTVMSRLARSRDQLRRLVESHLIIKESALAAIPLPRLARLPPVRRSHS